MSDTPRITNNIFFLLRFGGSAAVTALNPCQVCLHVSKEEEKQRLFELNEFKLLQKQDKIEMNSMGDTYLLVTSWFSTWESWVLGKAREPPGQLYLITS